MATLTIESKNGNGQDEVVTFNPIVEAEAVAYDRLSRMRGSFDNLYINDIYANYLNVTVSGKVLYSDDGIAEFLSGWANYFRVSKVLEDNYSVTFNSEEHKFRNILCHTLKTSIRSIDNHAMDFSLSFIVDPDDVDVIGNDNPTLGDYGGSLDSPYNNTPPPRVSHNKSCGMNILNPKDRTLNNQGEADARIVDLSFSFVEKLQICRYGKSVVSMGARPVDIAGSFYVSTTEKKNAALDKKHILDKYVHKDIMINAYGSTIRAFCKAIITERHGTQKNYAVYSMECISTVDEFKDLMSSVVQAITGEWQ